MDVYVKGQKVRLTQAEFKAQGGEGSVYVKGQTAYKVYADPAKMIPAAKVGELSALTLPDIIRPQEVLLNEHRRPIGYTMRSVSDGLVLCRTFPRAFRERMGLTPEMTLRLVRALQEGVAHVHAQGILIVDLNEMNFLTDSQFRRVCFIDVDSYQTRHFPATALMDSVRDRHATVWNEGTDWFSFAIVSFQMFVGIHPYKGKHPTLKSLDERMKGNISSLHPDVSVPATCLPFDVIPRVYRDWYRAVLEGGQRLPPPQNVHETIALPAHPLRQAGSDQLKMRQRLECRGTILLVTQDVIVTTEAIYFHGRRCMDAVPGVQIGLTTQNSHAVAARLEGGRVRLFDLARQQELTADIAGENLTAAEGRLSVKQGMALSEIGFVETQHGIWPHVKTVGTVLENATQLFEGVALQCLLGAWHASLLPRHGVCYQVRLPQFDGCQVMDAKFQSGVLMVIAARAGRYQKFIFRFDGDYAAYDVRLIPDLTAPSINFTVLDSGVCLHLNEDEELEIFAARQGASGLKVIADPALRGDCLLFHDGAQALVARGNALFEFFMR